MELFNPKSKKTTVGNMTPSIHYERLIASSESPTSIPFESRAIAATTAAADFVTSVASWMPAAFFPHDARVHFDATILSVAAVFSCLPLMTALSIPLIRK